MIKYQAVLFSEELSVRFAEQREEQLASLSGRAWTCDERAEIEQTVVSTRRSHHRFSVCVLWRFEDRRLDGHQSWNGTLAK